MILFILKYKYMEGIFIYVIFYINITICVNNKYQIWHSEALWKQEEDGMRSTYEVSTVGTVLLK